MDSFHRLINISTKSWILIYLAEHRVTIWFSGLLVFDYLSSFDTKNASKVKIHKNRIHGMVLLSSWHRAIFPQIHWVIPSTAKMLQESLGNPLKAGKHFTLKSIGFPVQINGRIFSGDTCSNGSFSKRNLVLFFIINLLWVYLYLLHILFWVLAIWVLLQMDVSFSTLVQLQLRWWWFNPVQVDIVTLPRYLQGFRHLIVVLD